MITKNTIHIDLESIYNFLHENLNGFSLNNEWMQKSEDEYEDERYIVKRFRLGNNIPDNIDEIKKALLSIVNTNISTTSPVCFNYQMITISLVFNKQKEEHHLSIRSIRDKTKIDVKFNPYTKEHNIKVSKGKTSDFAEKGKTSVDFRLYSNGELWNTSTKGTVYPCSMKDLFIFQKKNLIEYYVIYSLLCALGKTYYLFKDIASDFKLGSAYASIPFSEFYKYNTRRELLQSYYGTSLKRNNRESIGKGIFLCRIAKYVDTNDIQLLYNYEPPVCHITRDKESVKKPLLNVLCNYFSEKFNVKRIDKDMVSDTIRLSMSQKKPIKIGFPTYKSLVSYHNDLYIQYEKRFYDTVKIPKDSKFKKLKMPKGCVRLKTRKQFLEEGAVNHHCVATYIEYVNMDECSIWSLRTDDGKRFTIEIRMKYSKKYPKGYYYIHQMRGVSNCDPPKELYEYVNNYLDGQGFC